MAPVGPADEPLLVLSLRDAIAAGAEFAVIVTRPELIEPLQQCCDRFIGRRIPIEFAVQSVDDRPFGGEVDREKPWGTGHAVWAARKQATQPFAVINADDYYGTASMALAGKAAEGLVSGEAALIAYRLGNTLSDSGGVSRAVCSVDGDRLVGLQETYDIRRVGSGLVGRREADVSLEEDVPVSINLWAFRPDIFPLLEREFGHFLRSADLANGEFGLPQTVQSLMASGDLRVTVALSSDRWFGLTFAEDLPAVRANLAGATTR